MSIQETISLIFAVAFLIIAVCVVFVTYFLVKALKSLKILIDSLQNTSEDLRGRIQSKFFTALPALFITIAGRLLGIILKRGR